MNKIKAFIEYTLEMEQKMKEALQVNIDLYLFNQHPYFTDLQEELEKQAEGTGVLSVRKGLDCLVVHLSSKTFDSIGFTKINEETNFTEGISWTHYTAVEDGIEFTTCKQTKNASA